MKSSTDSSQRTFHHHLLSILLSIIVVFQVLVAPPSAGATGPQPGAANPAQTYAKWPEDEIFEPTAVLSSSVFQMMTYDYQDGSLQEVQPYGSFPAASYHDAIAPVAGRMLTPERDSLLYAYNTNVWSYSGGWGYDLAINTWRAGTISPVHTIAAAMDSRVNGGSEFLDMAAADLDGLPTGDGEYRDEVVVAYAQYVTNSHDPVRVSVLDFIGSSEGAPAPTAVTSATSSSTLDKFDIASFYIKPVDNALAVATGDFDGNGVREIAVAYLSSRTALTIDVFRYSASVVNHVIQRSLVRVGTGSIPLTSGREWNETVALAAGDFDGDGREELTLGTVDRASSGDSQAVHHRLIRLTGSSTLAISQINDTVLATGTSSGKYWRVHVATGLFKFDPANGWNLNRRQIAVAYDNGTNTYVRTIEVDSSLTPAAASSVYTASGMTTFWLAAGRFTGTPTVEDPYGSLVLSYWKGTVNGLRLLKTGSGSGAPSLLQEIVHTAAGAVTAGARLPAIAMDYDGDSMYLGAPLHLYTENLVRTDFILEEPPKHAYWDPVAKQVVNVSRYDDFAISLYDSAGTEFSSNTKDTSSLAVGASIAGSATSTGEAHGNAGIAKMSESYTLEATAKIGYDYNDNRSSYESNYADNTAFFSGRTDRDDFIVGRLQSYDIWRYRIFGSKGVDENGNPVNAFLDLILPGPYDDLSAQAGGLNFDFYQPLHENGNILSYPAFDPAFITPSDLGSYTIPCPNPDGSDCNADGTKTMSGRMYDPVLMFWDQTSNLPAGSGLKFSTASGGGTERTYSHSLNENLSLKASTKTTASIGNKAVGASASVSYSVDFEQSLKVTWGTATTTNSKTTDSTGITLYKRAGTAEKAYGFYPIIYETNTGTIRATYAVEPLASNTGKGFWISQYGQKPDLALNLPNRFQPSITETGLVVWVPTTSDLRKQMRGMRFYKDETGTTGEPIPLTGAATDGQMVHIEVPVYNYSVTQSVPAGVQVCYDASPYDPSTNTENASLRFRIGCTTLPLMSPRQITTASIPWNTKDASHASVQIYRIYVVLDPDNRVDEKYETETAASQTYSDPVTRVYVDPGQNNEGFSYATVVAAVATNPGGLKPQAHVGMAKDAIVAVNLRGKLVDGNVRAYLGRPLQLRITINSDKPSNEYSTLLLYDGDPDKGGVLIGGKQIFSGQVSNSAWFDWIPTTRGQHRLFAKVLQSVFDPAPGDNLGMLKVEVIPAPKKPTH